MGADSDLDVFSPNRPDALGLFQDSRVGDDPRAPYSRSRYAAALGRLVDRLLMRADAVKGDEVRGKRRQRIRPQERSNTVRTYLKAVELFSYYCVGQFGRELEPREINTDVAIAFARWMAGEGSGPDVRALYVRAMGLDYLALFEATQRACATYGQATIINIIEQLGPEDRQRFLDVSPDVTQPLKLEPAHRMMGRLIRAFKTIIRTPPIAELRSQQREIWSDRERDPLTYTYAMSPRTSLATGSVVTHLCSLSAVWNEMSKPTSPDEPPMSFNPWKSLYADWAKRMRLEKENERARGKRRTMTTPLVEAMLLACEGGGMSNRRDALALTLLAYKGLRAEELAGVQRGDVRDNTGLLSLNILGKGNKVRNVPIDGEERDALTLFTALLQEYAKETAPDEQGVRMPTYRARYASALLQPEAPLVPSLIRWGCNQDAFGLDRNPEKDALESLDTSGVRALVDKVSERARVKVVASGEIRKLTEAERALIHPHAFRHYAATAAREAGVDMMEIKLVLGHEVITTTETYIAVPPQISAAFSAGIRQTMKGAGPLDPSTLASLRRTAISALADPSIVAWRPQLDQQIAAVRSQPLSEQERSTVVVSPLWAYDRGDVLKSYAPLQPPQRFFADLKRRTIDAEASVDQARAAGDAAGYSAAVRKLAEVRARKLWNTFMIGRISRLPWWSGHNNQWQGSQKAPIISYAQVAAETIADGTLAAELADLHDRFYVTKGPTAATALVAWLGEMLHVVGIQFTKCMNERGHAWVPFDAQATPDAQIVREHHIEAILAWFEDYGWAVQASSYKSARNRGNMAIAAMDTLPDWMWVVDPLTDPQLGLPAAERSELRKWVQGLQATRPSRMRMQLWVEQMGIRLASWARRMAVYSSRTGKEWQWTDTYTDREAYLIALDANEIAKEIDDRFPNVFERVNILSMVRSVPDPSESVMRDLLARLMASKGLAVDDPEIVKMTPVMRMRSGSMHMFDPALLTFNDQDTIAHTEAMRKWWYQRYGTDSECVLRRALRTLWDRRKDAFKSQKPNLITRHFDVQLSSMIPCANEIEKRVREAGWTPPTTVAETVKVAKVMWAGLMDVMRATEGAEPVTEIPAEAVAQFWSTELPDFARLVETYSPAAAPIELSDVQREEVLQSLAQERPANVMAPAEPAPSVAPAAPEPEMPFPETQEQADSLARSAKLDAKRGWWKLDAPAFWRMIEQTPAKHLFVSSGPAQNGHFPIEPMRRYAPALQERKVEVWWDPINFAIALTPPRSKRVYRFVSHMQSRDELGAKGKFDYLNDPYVVIMLWLPDALQPNARPVWTDRTPWRAQWPGYPMPDPQDVSDPDVSGLPWPKDPVRNPRDACTFDACMNAYQRWKRNGVRPGGILPPGWRAGEALTSLTSPAMPHPVDVIFATVRPA